MTKQVKGRIARYICGGAFIFLLGVVGGMERFTLSTGAGAALIAVSLTVMAIAGLKGGIFK